MSFDDCGFLIRNIQLLCDEKFGHRETRHLFHQSKYENIRFDINDEVKDIRKKIRLIQERITDFNSCGTVRELYTKHKPPCTKSHLDPTDQKHFNEYENMYRQRDRCQEKLQEFHATIDQQLSKYKTNPNPSRHDILYKKYIIHLYDEQQRLEEELRLSILRQKEQEQKTKELSDIAERNKTELEEFKKQQAKERSKERSESKEEARQRSIQAEEHARQQKQYLIEQREREKQNTKFIEHVIRDINNTQCVSSKYINKYIKKEYIQHFITKSHKTIEDLLIRKMICYMFFHQISEADIKRIERHFDRIYAGLR
jgi:hypothetical protein